MRLTLGIITAVSMVAIAGPAFADLTWFDGPDTDWGRGHRYALTERGQWHECQAIAVGSGGNLVTINSEEENTWVFDTLRDHMTGDDNVAWIGFNDMEDEGHWEWVAGDGGWWEWNNPASTSYTNWYGGEPSGGLGEQHAAIYMHSYPSYEHKWCDAHSANGWQGIIEVVPEPSSLLGLILGVGFLIARRR